MKEKPRVLRIINRLNLGGPTYNAAYLTRYMTDFETLLVSGMKDDTEESSEFIVKKLGIEPVYIPEMYRELNPFRDYKSYARLRKIISEFRPHIVHTHAAKAGAVGRLAALHENVPVIVHTFHGHVFHSYFNQAKTKIFLGIERYLAKRTTKIITLSPKQLSELADEYKVAPRDKFKIIQLGFDLTRFVENQDEKRKIFRSHYQIEDDEVALGIIGRLVPVKNHSLFLKSLKIISAQTTRKIRAFIIGDGELRPKIEQEAKELGIDFSQGHEQRKTLLTFTSWIEDVSICNAGLDIILLTSNNEGTPVSLIEAQAAGKFIVSTRVGGIEDIVSENKNALLVEKNQPEAFASATLRVIHDDELRNGACKAIRDEVLQKFGYERLCADMSELYSTLLSGRLTA
ncbi:MAG: glycosyltransferase [Chitinophagales bacterium]|nr:glycosyltransferase [Chitinophagales bacterium]MDW8273438.1 glycosyltransferase [Chitinophagales bacterium]